MIIQLAATARCAVAIAVMASHQHIKMLLQLLGAVKPPTYCCCPNWTVLSFAAALFRKTQSIIEARLRLARSSDLVFFSSSGPDGPRFLSMRSFCSGSTARGLSLGILPTPVFCARRQSQKEHFDFLGYAFGPEYHKANGRQYLGVTPSKRVQRTKRRLATCFAQQQR